MKKMFKMLMVLAVAIFASNAYSVDIVKDGKSDWRIVVAPQAQPVTLRAAEDLQLYITKSTGANLPIEKTGTISGGHNIVVGDCNASVKAGINVSAMKPEGFVIKTIGDNLYIVGKDTGGDSNSDHWIDAPQAGTWSGVSTFLEKYLGIRWFFPGEYGEYVPETKNFSLGSLDMEDFPKMEYRRMSYLHWNGMTNARKKEVINWERRNKNGWSVIWNGSHSWIYNFRGEDYFKEHPEWFAEVNGRRKGTSEWGLGLQMCTTNPQALDKFAEIIIAQSRENGGRMFTLSPNDSGNHCECKNCRALDVEKLPDGRPVLTDRYVTYCNEIAKRVNKVFPDQTFGFYAYSYYMRPPIKTKLDPHVKVMHVLNGFSILGYSNKILDRYLNEMLIPWKKMTGSLYYYAFPEGMGNLALPCMQEGAIKNIYADLNKADITGHEMCNPSTVAASGLNNYLSLQMAWNPGADIDAIYADALDKCYGPKAAPYVKQYFDTLGRVTTAHANTLEFDTMFKTPRFPRVLIHVYDGLYEKGMPFLKQAAAAEADKNQKYRLQLVIDNLEYCRDTVELYKLSKRIIDEKIRDKKEVLHALDLTSKRAAYLASLRKVELLDPPTEECSSIETTEKQSKLPFSADIYQSILKEIESGTTNEDW